MKNCLEMNKQLCLKQQEHMSNYENQCYIVYQFAWAALTKYHCGLNDRSLLAHSSEDQKFMIIVPANSLSDMGSLPGLQKATFSPCLHMAFTQCMDTHTHTHMHTQCSLVSLLIRTLNLLSQGPVLMTSFNVNYFFSGPSPNTVTLTQGGQGFNI